MRSPVALHVRVTDAVAALTGLLTRLEDEIPEKKRNPHGGHGSGKGGHHPLAAWNSQAAMLVLDIHDGVRDLETDLRYQVTGRVRTRGGSDANTRKSLDGLPSLCSGVDQAAAMIACRKLESWIWRAQLVLGDTDPVSRLPRLPGQGDPQCPFGEHKNTLRVRHATGVVTCIHPLCRDSEGSRPQGRIEVGSYSAEPILAWSDGTTGVAVAA